MERTWSSFLFRLQASFTSKTISRYYTKKNTVYPKCGLHGLHSGYRSNIFPNRVAIYALSLEWQSKCKNQNSYNSRVNSEKLLVGRKNYLEGLICPAGRSLPAPDLEYIGTRHLNVPASTVSSHFKDNHPALQKNIPV